MSDETTPQSDLQMALDRIAALEAQLAPKVDTDTKMLDINDVRVPYVFRKFPMTVYRAGSKKGQIDHPGNLVTEAKNDRHLAELQEKGWQLAPVPVDPEAEAEDIAPAPKRGKK